MSIQSLLPALHMPSTLHPVLNLHQHAYYCIFLKELKQQLQSSGNGALMAAAVLPFARAVPMAVSQNGEMYLAVAKAIDVYLAILSVRVLLTWFRNINWCVV